LKLEKKNAKAKANLRGEKLNFPVKNGFEEIL